MVILSYTERMEAEYLELSYSSSSFSSGNVSDTDTSREMITIAPYIMFEPYLSDCGCIEDGDVDDTGSNNENHPIVARLDSLILLNYLFTAFINKLISLNYLFSCK